MKEFNVINLEISDLANIIEEAVQKVFDKQPKDQEEKYPDKGLLTTKDVMSLFKVSRVTIHNWKKSGLLPSIKMGNRVYFNEHEVRRIIEDKQVKRF